MLGRDEPAPPSGAVFTARSAPATPARPSRSIFEGVDAWDAVHLERSDAPPADHPDPSAAPPPPHPGSDTGTTDDSPLFPPPAPPPAPDPAAAWAPPPPPPTTAPEPAPAPEPRPVPRAVERDLEQPGGTLGPPPPSAPPRPVRSTTLSSAPSPATPDPVEEPTTDGHEDLARLAEELTRFAEEGSIPSEVESRPLPDAPTAVDPPAPDAPTAAEDPSPDLPTPPGTRVRVHGDRIDSRPGPIRLSPSEAIALARDGRSSLWAERPHSS
ncbi:MAG: hypothetical protein ACLGIR_08215 [Actinomycetes bacterium]